MNTDNKWHLLYIIIYKIHEETILFEYSVQFRP